MWQKVFMIPKGKGDFQGIVLVEVLWKAVASLLNRRFTSAITFHNVLHGFGAGWGTRTAALGAKLIQQLTAMREAVLFELLLDLRKAYNALYRERALDLLAEYGVGPMTVRLLWTYWACLTMVAKAGGYFGRLFKGYRGFTQGNPLPPTIFNVVMGAVICHWVMVVTPTEAGTGGLA